MDAFINRIHVGKELFPCHSFILANGWPRMRKWKKRRDIVCRTEIVEENRIQALLISFQWSFRCFSMNRHQLFPMGMKNSFPHVEKRSCSGYFFTCVTHGLLPFVSSSSQSTHWFSSDILSGHGIEAINHVWKTFLGLNEIIQRVFLDHRSIHFITVCRWLIEASLIPCTLMNAFAVYFNFEDEYIIDFNVDFIPLVVYMTKGALFVSMRYAELHSSSVLNDYQTYFFYFFCNRSELHQTPDHHRWRRMMPLRNMWIVSYIHQFTLIEWCDFTRDRWAVRDEMATKLFRLKIWRNRWQRKNDNCKFSCGVQCSTSKCRSRDPGAKNDGQDKEIQTPMFIIEHPIRTKE